MNLSDKHPLSLLQGRFGIYDKTPTSNNHVDGVDTLQTRLDSQGGHLQQERMIADKKRSLDRAVWYSYQAAEVRLLDSTPGKTERALMNPNRLSMDYDDKIVSIDFASGMKVGSVFEWVGTKSYWLVYLQDLTELAYFKGDVRKCDYLISWYDENGNKKQTYAAIKGPTQQNIASTIKHGISLDTPNYSLNILLPKTEETLKFFKRYTEFYLNSLIENNNPICWRVEAIDSISNPGILEVAASEHYINKDEDDVELGIVGGLIEEPASPNPEVEIINGKTFIKPKKEYIYSVPSGTEGSWKVDSKLPIDYEIADNTITIKATSSYSGQFDLYYGNNKKVIVVESLF